MNDDQLRRRIGRLDPLDRTPREHASIEPITSPTARKLLEEIMNTPLTTEAPHAERRRAPRPQWAMPAAAVAAIVGLGAVGFAVLNDGDESDTATPAAGDVLALDTGVEDLLASCPVLDATILAFNPVAFKGTVTSVDGSTVELSIDEAYAGTDAQMATLNAPEDMEALIGGVAWEVGGEYLIAAADGVVQYCSQSGPASPELQALYDEAFGG